MSYRNTKFLDSNRIIYRRDPISDHPDEVHDWGTVYYNGTHQCYDLFRTKAKITTYRSLKWHLLVIWYLNPAMDQDEFEYVARNICNKKNGFVTFTVSEQLLKNIIYDVSMYDLEEPPRNKMRKIIFKDTCQLTPSEKLHIVGGIMGRSKTVTQDDIYDAMLALNEIHDVITVDKLAKYFDCSARTIYRNMGNELKKEKELLNQQLKEDEKV